MTFLVLDKYYVLGESQSSREETHDIRYIIDPYIQCVIFSHTLAGKKKKKKKSHQY